MMPDAWYASAQFSGPRLNFSNGLPPMKGRFGRKERKPPKSAAK